VTKSSKNKICWIVHRGADNSLAFLISPTFTILILFSNFIILYMSDLNIIFVAQLFNVYCRSVVKIMQQQQRFYCKRVLSADEISFS
jgi:hypothetical protein